MRRNGEMLAASDERSATFAHLRNLPWPSAAFLGCGLQNLQDEVRKSRRAPLTNWEFQLVVGCSSRHSEKEYYAAAFFWVAKCHS